MFTLLTHGGMDSNKIVVGIGNYGRPFQQVDPSCDKETCMFTGPLSGATPGRCTNIPSYLAFTDDAANQRREATYVNTWHTGAQWDEPLI